MWNLESTYILSTIQILMRDFELTYSEVAELVKNHNNSVKQTAINLIYKNIHSYTEENEFYYANDAILSFVKNMISSNIKKEDYKSV